MPIISLIEDPKVIRKIREHVGGTGSPKEGSNLGQQAISKYPPRLLRFSNPIDEADRYTDTRYLPTVLAFDEAAPVKLPVLFRILDRVNRASGFLKREASVCLERTSIRAGLFFARHLML